MSTPHAQRLEALARANTIRRQRARFLADVRAGHRPWRDAFDEDYMSTATIYAVLVAVPNVGRVKATTALRRLGASPTRPLTGLTTREVEMLVTLIPPLGNGPAA